VPESAQPSWQAEVGDLLVRAAQACSQHGVDLDAFMQSAWSAYIGARPGLKEHLEELQLRTQLDELRRSGKVGTA